MTTTIKSLLFALVLALGVMTPTKQPALGASSIAQSPVDRPVIYHTVDAYA